MKKKKKTKKWYNSYPPNAKYLREMKKIKTSIEMEREFHSIFKSKCAREGKSMRDVMLELVQNYIGNSKGFSPKRVEN